MKKTLLFAAIAMLGAAGASATCWRINPSPYAGAQFKTVDDAMNDINVLPGDTLLLDPGTYGDITLKRENITIIGSGYFLSQNKQWAESQETIVNYITLSKGCKVEGCTASIIYSHELTTVTRCKVNKVYGNDNCIVEGCYIVQFEAGYGPTILRNNIIYNPGNGSNEWESPYYTANGHGSGSIIENNIIIGSNLSYIIDEPINSTIRNNIIINTCPGFDSNQVPYAVKVIDFNYGNNVIQNNVFSSPAKYANELFPHNLFVGATIENTFVNEGSEDAKWQLLETSAAKGAATHGGDCGAFGGPTPYVLSGIPQFLPHITEALIPARPTDGKITVKLKIENQNE